MIGNDNITATSVSIYETTGSNTVEVTQLFTVTDSAQNNFFFFFFYLLRLSEVTKLVSSKHLPRSGSCDRGPSSPAAAAATWSCYESESSARCAGEPWSSSGSTHTHSDGDGEFQTFPGRSFYSRCRRPRLRHIRAKMGSSLQGRFSLGWRSGRVQLAPAPYSQRLYFPAGSRWGDFVVFKYGGTDSRQSVGVGEKM